MNKIDRFAGCMLGAAIGDAFGMPTECISEQDLRERYNGKVTDFVEPISPHPNQHLSAGQYTDDAQQMIILAESLRHNDGLDIKDFGRRFAEWGRKNREDKNYWRFPGSTSLRAAEELEKGVSPYESGSQHTTSCGSAMRVAPIGLLYHGNIEQAIKQAELSSMISHNTQACKDGAKMVALTVANLLNEMPPVEAVLKASESLKDEILTGSILYAIKNRDQSPSRISLGKSSSIYDTVPFAVYSFLHSPENFREIMITAANAVPGDTDSFACIGGAFAGAHLGVDKIPTSLKTRLEDYPLIKRVAEDLYGCHLRQK